MKFKGLFIDIDDTLLRLKQSVKDSKDAGSLMTVLVDAGVDLGKLDREESKARVDWVNNNVRWWSWDHFIEKLEIDPDAFWQYAYNKEANYLEPTEEDLPSALKKLKKSNLNLFITSNNPNSGIKHKLRLAGFTNDDIDHLFTALLGATELQGMKWEPEYWQKAIKKSGLEVDEIAIIGDSLNDDHVIPTSVGLPFTFLIDPANKQQEADNLRPVTGLHEVAELFEKCS